MQFTLKSWQKVFSLGLMLFAVFWMGQIVHSSGDDQPTQLPATSGELNPFAYLPVALKDDCTGLIVDDFNNVNSGWPEADTGTTIYRYLNGEYNIYHPLENRWGAVTRGDYWEQTHLVKITGHIAAHQGFWGFVFGLNDNWSDFYTFEILPQDQIWAVFHFTSSSGWALVADGEHTTIQNGTNSLKIQVDSANENLLHLYINSTLVHSMSKKAGRVGLSGGSFMNNVDIRYDDYVFTDTKCPIEPVRSSAQNSILLYRPPIKDFLSNQ